MEKNYIDFAKGITPLFHVKMTEGERGDTYRVLYRGEGVGPHMGVMWITLLSPLP